MCQHRGTHGVTVDSDAVHATNLDLTTYACPDAHHAQTLPRLAWGAGQSVRMLPG